MMAAFGVRGIALGSFAAGDRKEIDGKVTFGKDIPMETLRFSLPRNSYTDE